ncbi:MAG TPA: proprotein convertase P-domain-containing protein [Kofleriaceae bacterium]|nr:proprotein convertase P-domain-containing protein [Kofleriaceae bacterium]
MKHALVALLATAGIARADELTATLEQPIAEVAHTVDISIADGVATYKVRRQFANRGKRADEASLAIDLPYGAAATGLRIRARDRWYDGDLMERDKAAALYHELTGMGAWRPKDPALLQWQWADKLHLQVFPVLPGQVSTVEYTLTVPTRYTAGRYWISYPRVVAGANADRASRPLVLPAVTVHPAWPTGAGAITVDGAPVAADAAVVLAPPRHEPWQDAVGAVPTASYVASAIDIPPSSHTARPIERVTVVLDIAHTFKSDLRVQLVTPQGQSIALHDGQGGDGNGVRGTFTRPVPAGTTGAGTWRLVASDHAALDTGAIDAWSLSFGAGADATTAAATDTPVFIPDAPETGNDAGVAAISIRPPAIATWTARFGRVVASPAHAFARLEVDTAPQLTALPRRAQVVFVVDASFSVGADHLAAQLGVIRAYLAHVPDAEVEVIAVRRRASRVFGRFVPAATALARLADVRALPLGNGSALDDGARLAAAALADRSGPRRVVITSDELWRDALTPERALAAFAALSSATVVHLVAPTVDNDDRLTLVPATDDRFAALATRHHGIHVELHGALSAPAKALASVVLELVRPTRIDHLAITGLAADATDVTTLHEGDGLRVFTGLATAPDALTLTGTLWSDPIHLALAPTPTFSRHTAAFVFGADEFHDLSPDEMMTVALLGRAVSPVTSYVAFEPGTRPSTIGLPDVATIGHGSGAGSGSGYGSGGGRLARRPDLRDLIDTTACERSLHPPTGWRVALDIETTRDEIVDVLAPSRDPLTTCLVEATWAVRLDLAAFPLERDRFHVELSPRAAPHR